MSSAKSSSPFSLRVMLEQIMGSPAFHKVLRILTHYRSKVKVLVCSYAQLTKHVILCKIKVPTNKEIGEVNKVCNNYLKDAEKATKDQLILNTSFGIRQLSNKGLLTYEYNPLKVFRYKEDQVQKDSLGNVINTTAYKNEIISNYEEMFKQDTSEMEEQDEVRDDVIKILF